MTGDGFCCALFARGLFGLGRLINVWFFYWVRMVRDFKELDIWKRSFELVEEIYVVVAGFPKEEIYGLSQQLKKAIVSVSSNIAEGCGRRTNKDFVQFLYMAFGSVREVESQLMIAGRLGYLDDEKLKRLVDLKFLLWMT